MSDQYERAVTSLDGADERAETARSPPVALFIGYPGDNRHEEEPVVSFVRIPQPDPANHVVLVCQERKIYHWSFLTLDQTRLNKVGYTTLWAGVVFR